MRNEFCTLFDVNYLPRGLALYRSLAEQCDTFHLRVYCVDRETKDLLDRLALPALETIGFDELERDDPELLAVKPTRSRVEYCWTATPAICLHALDSRPELESITYLDADLLFFHEPSPVFDELGDASVLIVPHRYAPPWQGHEEASGIYNVQFMTFKRTADGLEALRWWRDRCLEWCYFRVEDGKMGDQKYLDDWPTRFTGVHVLQHPGGGLAPWNIESYTLSVGPTGPLVDGVPLIFFHYHSLKLYRGGGARLRTVGLFRDAFRTGNLLWSADYPVTRHERRLVWNPYLRALERAYTVLRSLSPGFGAGFVRPPLRSAAPGPVRAVARTARRAKHLLEVRGRRHRGSWKSEAVAEQMRSLSDRQLQSADDVAPFSAFVEAVEMLVSDFDLPQPASFLDLGCGVGQYSDLLDEHFPGRFVYTGSDYSPEIVAVARAARPGRTFMVNDLLESSLDLGGYDVLFASGLIDVLDEFERGLDVLLGAASPIVLLHRQRVVDRPSYVEVADGYDRQRTYRSYLNRDDLDRIAARHGRTVARRFVVEGEVETFILPRVR
jgi:SAM-dependent methyltransferase